VAIASQYIRGAKRVIVAPAFQPATVETVTRLEVHGRIQKGWGTPETPTRSESVSFSQS